MRKDTKTTARSDKRLAVTATVIISFALLLCAYFFTEAYEKLNDSIRQERVEAVQEIGVLLSDRVQSLRQRYLKYVELYKDDVEQDVDSMDDFRTVFQDKEFVLLCMEDGSFITLSGEKAVVANTDLFAKVINSIVPGDDFISTDIWGDCWGFFVKLDDVYTEDGKVEGFILTTDDNEYDAAAVLPLYRGFGASYVINNEGDVQTRPDNYQGEELFDGENVISSLREKGVPSSIIASLESSLDSRNVDTQFTVEINDETWLVQCVPNPAGSNVIISIPVSKTAEGTFTGMSEVTLMICVLIILISALLFVWVVYYIRNIHRSELEKEKITAKSSFMSKMSHDIRTPLNAIIGLNRLARDSVYEPEIAADYLDKSFVSCEYLLSLINDVLDMSKIESGKMVIYRDAFDMRKLLENMIQIHETTAKDRGLQLKLETGHIEEGDHIGDALHIRQCLVNLLSNAIKFTPNDGTVTLRYSEKKLDSDEVEATFTVEDTGIGMSEEFQRNIFKPFEQEHSSMTGAQTGSGLGLSIVNSLVNLMDGTVKARSAPGEGSSFTIMLPLSVSGKTTIEDEPQNEREFPTGLRLTVAEDNFTNRIVVSKLLEKLGEKCDQAEDGQKALELFEASDPGAYDMIFMDIQMPVMDGLEAARAIRASAHPDAGKIPIVALSANAYKEDVEQSLNAGMQGHVSKPVDSKNLREAILRYYPDKNG